MAIHIEQTRTMGGGHVKTLDSGAIDMILDNLQKSQYASPIKSTTREIVCNAIDSIQEKIAAQKILRGEAKVEDYFVTGLQGEVYKDSNFDRTYYDPSWLSDDNTVEIRYKVGSNMEKDYITIKDYGVGLGGDRLAGYFKLGFSTKRLSRLPVGKFGIGGKAPLSTGVDFYTMESNYNGKKFRFNIYSSTYDSIIPAFNLATGTENEYILFDDYKVYWEPTTEPNGVTITIATKKHHKQQYIDAVKSQLLYFDNISLVVEEDGIDINIPYRADIMYEDDYIVLSDNNYYSKPHLLLNKVNYGYIDWSELELEERAGNIGIKIEPELLDVNPSRESVTWTDRTKEMVLSRFKKVVEIATDLINQELKETDFLKWIKSCYLVSKKFNSNGVLSRLSKIVDLSSAKIKYIQDPRIQFIPGELLNGLYARNVVKITESRVNKKHSSIKRKEIKSLSDYINLPILLIDADTRASNRKDKWLLSMYPDGFVTIHAPYNDETLAILSGISEEALDELKTFRSKRYGDSKYASTEETWEYLCNSTETIKYEDIEVPEDFNATEEEEDVVTESEEEVKQEKVSSDTTKERRKLEGKILLRTLQATHSNKLSNNNSNRDAFPIIRFEYPIKDINTWDAKEVYYSVDGEDEMLQLVSMITRDIAHDNELGSPCRRTDMYKWNMKYPHGLPTSSGYILNYYTYGMQHFCEADTILVKVSKANCKYLRDFKPITEFFLQIKNNTITMSNILIQWNTARLIKAKLAECAFLYNFEGFNSKYSNLYRELMQYVEDHYREVFNHVNDRFNGLNIQSYQDLTNHLDAVMQFQQFVANNPGSSDIAVLAMKLFGNEHLTNGMAVDPEYVNKMEQVLEFCQSCGTLLNQIPLLTGYDRTTPTYYTKGEARSRFTINEALEQEIKLYLEYKGLLTYEENTNLENPASIPADLQEIADSTNSMVQLPIGIGEPV